MTDVQVRAEPLTYRQDGEHGVSFFQDLLVAELHGEKRAVERLSRHRSEMDVISLERQARAWRGIRGGDVEYRVEPDRTPGTGGNFAPPLWLVNLFASAKRPGRSLAGLIPAQFELPLGVSSVNLPILTSGTTAQAAVDDAAVAGTDITDFPGSSTVVTLASQADVPLQMLEQSPAGSALDWALFQDMTEATDYDLETQLLYGLGTSYSQLTGVTNVSSIVGVTYSSGSPTGSAVFPYLGQAAAQLADGRLAPPEIILMRHARFQWIATQEDTTGRPFGLPTPWYFGSGPSTPDPIAGINGLPVFGDEAISAVLGAAANQDQIIILRPTDLMLFEGQPVTNVYREPLSGNLGARIQMHKRVAAITNRYSSGIATVGGSGFTVQEGY
jgi:hypothetical protein